MKSFKGIVELTAGQTSYTVNNLNMPRMPIGARGDVMKTGACGAIIGVSADVSSFVFAGGAFYFTSAIPSDTTYQLLYEFILP